MAIMKTYSKDEMNHLSKTSKKDGEKLLIQPERSKREDDIMYLKCGKCNDYYHVFLDQNHISRCGALNSMET